MASVGVMESEIGWHTGKKQEELGSRSGSSTVACIICTHTCTCTFHRHRPYIIGSWNMCILEVSKIGWQREVTGGAGIKI